jgi:serine/threonine protein phosphatase 1
MVEPKRYNGTSVLLQDSLASEEFAVIYAVGDIHGVLEELERVLGLVRSHASAHGIPRPKVVFLGAAIDRGPDSRAVVERLMGPRLRDEIEPVVLQGNHKAMLVDGATDWSQAEL